MLCCGVDFAAKKRFYKDVSVVSSGGDYEITLDSKKLKTPGGSVLTLGNQSLALAVAHEWQSQKEQILLSQMHLTGLCNTAIDNPTSTTKYDLVDNILNFLDTDTLLFFSEVSVTGFFLDDFPGDAGGQNLRYFEFFCLFC